MARYKCPCCGAAFNGKRCRNCYYEVFTEEISHGLHTHSGEPLVIDAPVRKPIRWKDPFGCERKTRKPSRILGIVVALIVALGSVVGDIMETHMDSADALLAAPEPDVTVPESAVTLYRDAELTIRMDWREGTAWPDELPLYLENLTGQELNMVAGNITVNGYVIDDAYLFSTASDQRIGLFRLNIEENALREAGITTIADVSFRLSLYNADTYETVAETQIIRLHTDAPADFVQSVDDSGTLLWAQDGIRVIFREYKPDDYAPEDISNGTLLFYLENSTDRTVDIYTGNVTVNQAETHISLWSQLPPDSRAVSTMYLHDLEDLEISRPEDITDFTITFAISDPDDWEYGTSTGPLAIDLGE